MKNEKFMPEKLWNECFKYVPRLGIELIIKSKEGVLLAKRGIKPGIGYWYLPGRTVRAGERIKQAVLKAAREETGLKVRIKKFLGIYDDPKTDPRHHVIRLNYLCEKIGGELKTNKENTELRFFKKLPKNIGFGHRKIIKRFLKSK